MIAREMGMQTVTQVTNHAGRNPQAVLIGIKGEGNRGMGVNIVNGKIEFAGDDWMQTQKLEEFRARVDLAYKATTYQAALTRQGYQTSISYQQTQKRYVLAGAKA
jgi:hypothetical protein